MPSNHLILCCPLLLLPSIFPIIRVFFNESVLLIRWPKYWSFSFNISHSNEYSGLISFRMDWLDCLAVQGILKSLLQHHSSKPSILQHSAFFIVQFSHTYVTTEKPYNLRKSIFSSMNKDIGGLFSIFFLTTQTILSPSYSPKGREEWSSVADGSCRSNTEPASHSGEDAAYPSCGFWCSTRSEKLLQWWTIEMTPEHIVYFYFF